MAEVLEVAPAVEPVEPVDAGEFGESIWMGSKNPVPVKNAILSNAQKPMRPMSLRDPPMSFHAGIVGCGG